MWQPAVASMRGCAPGWHSHPTAATAPHHHAHPHQHHHCCRGCRGVCHRGSGSHGRRAATVVSATVPTSPHLCGGGGRPWMGGCGLPQRRRRQRDRDTHHGCAGGRRHHPPSPLRVQPVHTITVVLLLRPPARPRAAAAHKPGAAQRRYPAQYDHTGVAHAGGGVCDRCGGQVGHWHGDAGPHAARPRLQRLPHLL